MRLPLLAFVAAALTGSPLTAQVAQSSGIPHRQVISIQPLSAIFTVYAGEFERAIGPSVTLGAGATYWGDDDEGDDFSYLSTDLKLRYYPSGALHGFSFGGSVGFTRVEEDRADGTSGSTSGPSLGTMLDYGWLLNANRSFYVGLGIGAKVLFIDEDDVDEDVLLRYPTARLSVGWAF